MLATSLLMLALAATDPPAPLPQVASGRIERLADFPSTHVPPRHVDVWLPEGYPDDGPYDVLYMHDGQMLFDAGVTWNRQEWQVDEVAGRLIAEGAVRPFIVVGVWNAGPRRWAEYFPQPAFESLDAAQRTVIAAQAAEMKQPLAGDGVHSRDYLRFLVEELQPVIAQRFRIATGPAHTAVMGSSMGGLASLHALSTYPRVFGAAACLSTHWPGGVPSEDSPLPAALRAWVADQLPEAGAHRLWFDHGDATLDALYPPLQGQVDPLIAAKGYVQGQDWITRAFPGTDHSEKSWAARLDQPLRFLFPPADSQ
ncbi:MAG: esterase family protein [Xanthomonadaceae bacterium]|nr:esterase family protein [Xanthomonadaceae bacterium]